MDKLAHLIANHLQESPLRPEWPETILSSIIDRREHLAELTRRITEAEQQEQRPGRLYDAIEPGTTDLNDAGLKKRIVGLAAIRAQAKADTERTQAAPDHAGSQAVSPDMAESLSSEKPARTHDRKTGANGVIALSFVSLY